MRPGVERAATAPIVDMEPDEVAARLRDKARTGGYAPRYLLLAAASILEQVVAV